MGQKEALGLGEEWSMNIRSYKPINTTWTSPAKLESTSILVSSPTALYTFLHFLGAFRFSLLELKINLDINVYLDTDLLWHVPIKR